MMECCAVMNEGRVRSHSPPQMLMLKVLGYSASWEICAKCQMRLNIVRFICSKCFPHRVSGSCCGGGSLDAICLRCLAFELSSSAASIRADTLNFTTSRSREYIISSGWRVLSSVLLDTAWSNLMEESLQLFPFSSLERSLKER